ncbi:hypothetical protein GCM10009665_33450 [Kitasatospora nipponensis]|uniref:Uncharacterized protein n=1 Tax=Kitasatospora nipponensis TaxID=258049 RepID=A0ABP4GVF1_9ACTN
MALTEYGEHVVVEANHVRTVLRTLDLSGWADCGPDLAAAIDRTREQAAAQCGAPLWRLPAEDVWLLSFFADGQELYSLDEGDEATYAHPSVLAEHCLWHDVHEQAPATDAALEAITDAEVELIFAEYHQRDENEEHDQRSG